jgi:glycerol-3-phosphate responsive antiterminator
MAVADMVEATAVEVTAAGVVDTATDMEEMITQSKLMNTSTQTMAVLKAVMVAK